MIPVVGAFKSRSAAQGAALDDPQAEAIRGALEYAGADSINRAREMWWMGLRDAEKETYQAHGGNFDEDERFFAVVLRPHSTPPIAANPTRSVALASAIGIPPPMSVNPSGAVTNAVAPILKR